MNKKIFITVFVLFACMATGFAQLYTTKMVHSATSFQLNQLAEKNGVTAMSISKSMLDLFPEMTASVEKNGVDIKKISNQIDQIDIFVSKTEEAKNNINSTHKMLMNSPFNEVFMRIKDETSNIVFYGFKDTDNTDKLITSFIMYIKSEQESVLIRLIGGFTLQDINEIIKMKKENDQKSDKK
jgi:hypothetical protein